MSNPFQIRQPHIAENKHLRTPQREAYQILSANASNSPNEREIGVVLPVGCGKSGCITLTPFAFKAKRTLVVAPSIAITKQLVSDFDPTNASMFYQKCYILPNAPYPEPVEIRGTTTNLTDLNDAHVVITNIQQMQGGDNNRWLQTLSQDFFDLIIFDEGHHSVADSYTMLKDRFPDARIVNFSATPLRADGKLMAGRVLYSYPIFRAIQEGYVKRMKAIQLNPSTLRYVRLEDGQEIEVDLAEVKKLGEIDAGFRRSIVTSTETLNTIVDASIRELERLRSETSDKRLKIIASALNFEHCHQIVEAYRARNRRADYVHSLEDTKANNRVMQSLDNHQLDVIVQVRKLGEGFDHPYLSVAAVFSVFSNLSPFVQFVGRIMRVIQQNDPGHALNQGVVIFHAGANIARQWSDFQHYSQADQEYFDQLLPLENIDPNNQQSEREIVPAPQKEIMKICAQSDVRLEEIPLSQNADVRDAVLVLHAKGCTLDDITVLYQSLQPIPTTKVLERQAKRNRLDKQISNIAAKILNKRYINLEGNSLDRKHLGRSNFVVMKSVIDSKVNATVGKVTKKRHEFSRAELDKIELELDSIADEAEAEVFNGTN